MCGLLGFTGDAPADPGKLRVLFLANKSRGTDSTGMYGTRMIKKVGQADNLLADPNFDNIARSRIVIGHTRSSTGTARTKENAHPFAFGHRDDGFFVVGAHNGSIFNEYEMEAKIKGFERGNVDSESIYKAMHHTKDIHVIAMLEGHVALTFRIDDVVYVYRRDSRPLFLGKAREGWYWSSIKDSLKLISIPEEKIFDVEPHKLLAFRGSRLISHEEIAKPRVNLDASKTSYNWDYGLSAELKEELTGKKAIPAVDQRTTAGFTTAITTTTNHQTKERASHETRKALASGLISLKQMGVQGTPRLYGRNILVPSIELDDQKACVNFIGKSMVDADTDLRIYPNKFKTDQSSPFWLKDVNSVIMSNLFIFPQSIEKRPSEPIAASTARRKDDAIHLNIKPVFTSLTYNESYGTIHDPVRKGLYLFFKVDEDSVSESSRSKYMVDAVGFTPVVCPAAQNGYVNINIPSYLVNEITSDRVRIRIGIADVKTIGFIWETSITIEKGTDCTLIAAMCSPAQGFFESSYSAYLVSNGATVSMRGFKRTKEDEINPGAGLEMAVKGVFRGLKGANPVIPLFLETQISKSESRSLFTSSNNVKKIIEMKSYGEIEPDAETEDYSKKKVVGWD